MPGSNTGPAGGIHQQLVNRLKNPDPLIAQEKRTLSKILGARLDSLRQQRHTCDYSLGAHIDVVSAQNACTQALQILGKI